MTDQPQPPPYDADDHPHVVQQLTVPTAPSRVPRPGGLAIVVLGIVVAVLAGYIAVLLIDARHSRTVQRQLACEVQRLGGQGIAGVDCPRPTPSPRAGIRPVPPSPVPSVVLVVPTPAPGPPGPRGPAGPAATAPRSTPAAKASRPPSSPAARPSPTPSCRLRNPAPVGPACLQQGARRPS